MAVLNVYAMLFVTLINVIHFWTGFTLVCVYYCIGKIIHHAILQNAQYDAPFCTTEI